MLAFQSGTVAKDLHIPDKFLAEMDFGNPVNDADYFANSTIENPGELDAQVQVVRRSS